MELQVENETKEITKKNLNDDITDNNGELVFNPYNTNNKEITLTELKTILRSYGLPGDVYNIELYKRAFCHSSYTKRPELENLENNITVAPKPSNCLSLKTKSNERLEFLGDGILEAITKYYLYRRFPKANEGFMTEKKIVLVKNESIGKFAYEMKLNKWLLLSKHAEEKKGRTTLKKLGCLFEAFLGALFLDCNKMEVEDEENLFKNLFVTGPGFQMAQIFVENVFEKHVDWTNLINTDDNYKNILQVKIQKEFKVTPDYLEINNDDNGYEMGVYLCLGKHIHEVSIENSLNYDDLKSFEKIHEIYGSDGSVFVFLGKGLHKIKKKAEQMACFEAISKLNKK